MKKMIAAGSIIVLVLALSGCGSSPTVTEDEAKQALLVGFVSVFSASIGLAFGQEVPGAALDEDTQELTLDGFSIADLAGEDSGIPYTSVSGSAVSSDEGAMVANLTFEGGPVKSIGFTMNGEQLESEAGFTITVTVNGKEMELEMTQADLQSI